MKIAHTIIYTHSKWRRDTYTKKLPGDNVSAQARYIPLKDLLPGLQDGYWFDNVDNCSQYLLQLWDLPSSIVQQQEAEPEVLSRELVRQARLSISCDYWNFVHSYHSTASSQEHVHTIYAFERP